MCLFVCLGLWLFFCTTNISIGFSWLSIHLVLHHRDNFTLRLCNQMLFLCYFLFNKLSNCLTKYQYFTSSFRRYFLNKLCFPSKPRWSKGELLPRLYSSFEARSRWKNNIQSRTFSLVEFNEFWYWLRSSLWNQANDLVRIPSNKNKVDFYDGS